MSDKMRNIDVAGEPSTSEQEKHFSQGLRVLAIDDNIVCLKVLAFQLHKCGYEVTTSTRAAEAIELLRKNKDGFDIVITDVIMSDIDGFKLLEIIGLEMDIPVIMTSADGDMKTIERGVMHGACDYLVKPVRMEILRNIWQHVIRKTTYNPRPAQKIEANRRNTRNTVVYKRNSRGEDREVIQNQSPNGEFLAQKKPRVTWTPELHAKFVASVQQLGVGAVPKNILRLMNDPRLTRENVASHLQKYRSAALKQKERMSQENKNPPDANGTRHLYDATVHTSSLNNLCFQSMNPAFLTPNRHPDLFLQQNNPVASSSQSQNVDQIPQTMNIAVLTPSPIPALDPGAQLDFSAVQYPLVQYRRNYEQMPPQIPPSAASGHPGFSSTWSGGISNRPIQGVVSHPCASGALINRVGTSNHMCADAPGKSSLFSQPDSIAGLVLPNSLRPGHHEAGEGGSDFRWEAKASGPLVKMRAQIDGSTENEQINYTQFTLNNSDREIQGHHMNESSLDDDLSAIVRQFSEDAAPSI